VGEPVGFVVLQSERVNHPACPRLPIVTGGSTGRVRHPTVGPAMFLHWIPCASGSVASRSGRRTENVRWTMTLRVHAPSRGSSALMG